MKLAGILLIPATLLSASSATTTEDESDITTVFLTQCAIWSGDFTNFVWQKGGVIQRGKIRMKVSIDDNGVIRQRVALIKPDGTAGDYEGYSTLKVEGKRLKWVEPVNKDENTGNVIENHNVKGWIGPNHVYMVEEYQEIYPDGRKEKRRNNLHYFLLDGEKLLWLADIHVDDQLLVYANTILTREK